MPRAAVIAAESPEQRARRLDRQRRHDRTYRQSHPKRIKGNWKSSPERNTWNRIKQRCGNPKNTAYASYGGRGIRVCERWIESFANFLADMGPKPSPAHSIDRINNDGPYSPENCRWATAFEQANNTRQNRFLTWNGETRTIAQWAVITGFTHSQIWDRLRRGWTDEKALSTPIDPVWSAYAKRRRRACNLSA